MPSSCCLKAIAMRNGSIARISFSSRPHSLGANKPPPPPSSPPPPPYDLGNILLIASLSKAFSRSPAVAPSLDPSAISDHIVLQLLRRHSLHSTSKIEFFRWASSLPTYTPSPTAYSELFRSLCRSGHLDDLGPLLHRAMSSGTVDQSTLKLVLDAFIRAGRFDSAIDALDDMEELGTGPALNPEMYNSIVLALLKKSQLGLALSMFEKLLESSADFDTLTCNELLVALRKDQMRDEFRRVFDKLTERGFQFDTWTYNICIHAFGCWGELGAALRLFREMRGKDPPVEPDLCTYNSLIRALCSAGKIDDALKAYEELKGSGHNPDVFTYRTIIQGCCKTYRVDNAIRVFGEMEYNSIRADTVLYNCLLDGLLKARKLIDACQLFERMVTDGIRASSYTYNILIDGLFRNGRSEAAFTLFCDLKKKGKFVDAVTYSIVALQLCREGQLDKALELVEEMEARGFVVDLVTVSSLLIGLHKNGRWDWAERLMKHVRASILVPSVLKWTEDMEVSLKDPQDRRKDFTPPFPARGDFTDIMDWMNPVSKDTEDINLEEEHKDEWSSSPYLDRLSERFKSFEDFRKFSVHKGKRVQEKGIESFDTNMVNTYLSIFLVKGKLSIACKLFEIFTEMGRDPVTYTYNALVSSFVKKGYFREAWGVLDEMGEKFCPADIATYNVIIQGLGKIGKADLASTVLDQLMKKGGYLDIVMYNTLIHALGKAGRIDEANGLFKQMSGSGINPDVVTFNTLIEVHAKVGRVKDAYRFLRMMLDAGCSPNHITDTILDFLEREIEKLRYKKASIKRDKETVDVDTEG